MQADEAEILNASTASDEVLKGGSLILYGDRKVKYLKPRIGSYFQAKVEKYIAPTRLMADEDEDDEGIDPTGPCLQKPSGVVDSTSSKRRRRGTYKVTRQDHGTF